jgi:hypothetical protein
MGVKLGLSYEHRLRVFENRVLKEISSWRLEKTA